MDDHNDCLFWDGWESTARTFGLEMQRPWARMVLDGRKRIETRSYNLPPALLGRKIFILESQMGNLGSVCSGIGNIVKLGDLETSDIKCIGWCVIHHTFKYSTRLQFESDYQRHCVAADSNFGWKEGEEKVVYGWEIGTYGYLHDDDTDRDKTVHTNEWHLAIRRMRSLFQLYHVEESKYKDI